MKNVLVLFACLLCATMALAQNSSRKAAQAAKNLMAANIRAAEAVSCGDPKIQFDVTRDQNPPASSLVVPGKARIFVIEILWSLHPNIGDPIYGPVVRVGMDGKWINAVAQNSYAGFAVAPGIHHLCIQRQAKSKKTASNVALLGWNAQPGKSYYFIVGGSTYLNLWLQPMDEDKARLLIAQDAPVPALATVQVPGASQ